MKKEHKMIITTTMIIVTSCHLFGCREDIKLGIEEDPTEAYKGKIKTIEVRDLKNSENSYVKQFSYTTAGKFKEQIVVNGVNDTLSRYVVTYSADGNSVSTDSLIKTDGSPTEIREFTYSQKRISKYFHEVGDQKLEYNFQYDNSSNLVRIAVMREFGGNQIEIGKGEYMWKNGNVVKLTDNLTPGSLEVYEYQFDSTSNPLVKLYSDELLPLQLTPGYLSKNALVVTKSSFKNELIKIDYEKDGEELPKKVLYSQMIAGKWIPIKEELYEYW